jgi:methylated-DNA-[protein]-cysteine S-methyltransferase
MARWTLVEGALTDGLPMRLYIAEHDGKLWSASLHDDEHPISEDEFAWRLRGTEGWARCERRACGDMLANAAREMEKYFAGRLLAFETPMNLRGTSFQRRVWQELTGIPFGATRTYGEIAESIGHPAACRAVGSANGRNNLPVFVPCHRVLAAGGKLGGFTGGIGLKKRLLDHETAVLGKQRAA